MLQKSKLNLDGPSMNEFIVKLNSQCHEYLTWPQLGMTSTEAVVESHWSMNLLSDPPPYSWLVPFMIIKRSHFWWWFYQLFTNLAVSWCINQEGSCFPTCCLKPLCNKVHLSNWRHLLWMICRFGVLTILHIVRVLIVCYYFCFGIPQWYCRFE